MEPGQIERGAGESRLGSVRSKETLKDEWKGKVERAWGAGNSVERDNLTPARDKAVNGEGMKISAAGEKVCQQAR